VKLGATTAGGNFLGGGGGGGGVGGILEKGTGRTFGWRKKKGVGRCPLQCQIEGKGCPEIRENLIGFRIRRQTDVKMIWNDKAFVLKLGNEAVQKKRKKLMGLPQVGLDQKNNLPSHKCKEPARYRVIPCAPRIRRSGG